MNENDTVTPRRMLEHGARKAEARLVQGDPDTPAIC